MTPKQATSLGVVALLTAVVVGQVVVPAHQEAQNESEYSEILAAVDATTETSVVREDAGGLSVTLSDVRLLKVDGGVAAVALDTLQDGGAVLVVYRESPCVLPACVDDVGPVDCLATGAYGLPDGGPRWRGCNVLPREFAVGAECLPAACGTTAGEEVGAVR